MEVHDTLRQLAPFGLGNSKPVFVTRGLFLSNVQFMSDGAHIRLELYDLKNDPDMKRVISAVGFGMGNYSSILKSGDLVDIAYTMNIFNLWGNDTLSLHLSDIRPALPDNILWRQPDIIEKLYKSGMAPSQIVKLKKGITEENMLPSSENFGEVYKTIRDVFGTGISIVDADLLARTVSIKTQRDITPFCVMRCLDVFSEAGLIKLGRFSSCRVCLNIVPVKEKANLHDTPTYKRLYGNE